MPRPLIDPLTVRRAEKLTAMGWTQYEIASELGVSDTTVRAIQRKTHRLQLATPKRLHPAADEGAAYMPTPDEIEAAKREIRERNMERKRRSPYTPTSSDGRLGKIASQFPLVAVEEPSDMEDL